ncbi:uncharacterized protein J7T54_005178 [Emericellopsis cladophorae]|uniref:Glucose-methanol-choline oxidoreductase N-terminal domain-containing protein n=1 Tax=Emericellopsis cladophorae TaxID=2686198 RepID=A0A9Q0BDK1_9HYPO|nr:uncharacterized protein J7T54_005178 [Emericellopsis cladophorae]KAI6781967.1 hypothetical protein J7T54_005178 [Emericellopsis cladophorae]
MSYRTDDGGLHTGLASSSDAEPLGVIYPRAGTLGGYATHNALITVYPHDSGWEKLATLTGDSAWSAANMRQYFKRLKSARYFPNAIDGHGFEGWLTTSVTDLGLVTKDIKLLTVIVSAESAMGKGFFGLVLSTVNGLGASAEVILAAGAFNTPQLLKLSRVGPKAELDAFDIPVVAGLPGVGTKLQDRYETTSLERRSLTLTSSKAVPLAATVTHVQ